MAVVPIPVHSGIGLVNLSSGVRNCTLLDKFPGSGEEHYERAEPNLSGGVQNCTPLDKFPVSGAEHYERWVLSKWPNVR